MDDVIKRLDRIERLLESIVKSQSKVDDHVDFVERVYDAVRRPMNMIFRSNSMVPRIPPLIESPEERDE